MVFSRVDRCAFSAQLRSFLDAEAGVLYLVVADAYAYPAAARKLFALSHVVTLVQGGAALDPTWGFFLHRLGTLPPPKASTAQRSAEAEAEAEADAAFASADEADDVDSLLKETTAWVGRGAAGFCLTASRRCSSATSLSVMSRPRRLTLTAALCWTTQGPSRCCSRRGRPRGWMRPWSARQRGERGGRRPISTGASRARFCRGFCGSCPHPPRLGWRTGRWTPMRRRGRPWIARHVPLPRFLGFLYRMHVTVVLGRPALGCRAHRPKRISVAAALVPRQPRCLRCRLAPLCTILPSLRFVRPWGLFRCAAQQGKKSDRAASRSGSQRRCVRTLAVCAFSFLFSPFRGHSLSPFSPMLSLFGQAAAISPAPAPAALAGVHSNRDDRLAVLRAAVWGTAGTAGWAWGELLRRLTVAAMVATTPAPAEPPRAFPWVGKRVPLLMRPGVNFSFAVAWASPLARLSSEQCTAAVPAAVAAYTAAAAGDGGAGHYPASVHAAALRRALRVYRQTAWGAAAAAGAASVTAACEAWWQSGRQGCEARSLSGRPCCLPVHTADTDADAAVPSADVSSPVHSSGGHYVRACLCGASQATVPDPFSLAEAAAAFVAEAPCCLTSLVWVRSIPSIGGAVVKSDGPLAAPGKEEPAAGMPWQLVCLGRASDYRPSAGTVGTGAFPESPKLILSGLIPSRVDQPGRLFAQLQLPAALGCGSACGWSWRQAGRAITRLPRLCRLRVRVRRRASVHGGRAGAAGSAIRGRLCQGAFFPSQSM